MPFTIILILCLDLKFNFRILIFFHSVKIGLKTNTIEFANSIIEFCIIGFVCFRRKLWI